METTNSASDGVREFYLPATAVRSPVPGRIERFVVRPLREESRPARSPTDPAAIREFYLPATPRP